MNPNLIYDAGLHLGEDTDYYLKKGFKVIALEANPELVARCKARFRDPLASGQLQIVEGAIAPSSAGDTITFYRNPVSIWGTTEEAWAKRNAQWGFESETITLKRIDISEVYRTFGVPFYLKVDVEGVDLLVLEALKQVKARPRYVSIEAEAVDFDELRAELSLLHDLGYTKFKAVQQETVPGSSITTTTFDGRPLRYVFEKHASGPFGDDIAKPWLTFDGILEEYSRIFRKYRRYGEGSVLERMPKLPQRLIKKSYKLLTGRPLAGWYDTHASL